MKFNLKKDLFRLVIIFLSAALCSANLKIFVRVGNLFPGGFSGITVLIQRVSESYFGISLPYSPIYYLLNAVPIYIGFRYIGKKFTLFSCFDVFLVGIFTDMIPAVPLTYDPLLISVFGGILSGIAAALVLSVNASGGGTDFISMYLSEKNGIDSFHIILAFNTLILLVAGFLFGWENALYSIIYQYVSTQVLRILYKKFQQDTLLIITEFPEEICMAIDEVTHHGATILEARGAYEGQKKMMVYSVVSASESKQLTKDIRMVDPAAFVNVLRTQEIGGRFHIARSE